MTLPQSQHDPSPGEGRGGGLPLARRIAVGIVAGGVFLALVFLIIANSGGEMAVLYSNLSPEDASGIVSYLKESGVKYKITSGGATVMAPASKVYELRMELASKGVPQGAGSGFELFDSTSFASTEFTEKVNYTRALQGELARSIMALNPVQNARVHIVIPEKRLFSGAQTPATASIVISMKPGSYLMDAQVRGVVNLVAGAVQGLTADNITIVDTDGNLLWRGTGGGSSSAAAMSAGITSAQLEMKMNFEQEMQSRIESMLDRALGIGRAVVRVYADINFDQTERASETYQPAANGKGVPIAEQTSEEHRTSDDAVAAGLAGTPTNVEGYAASDAAAAGGSYTRTDSTVNYEVSKVVEKAVTAPGRVERISVAAVVDGLLTADRIQAIEQVISAAAGIRPERGDQVTVTNMEFAKVLDDDLSGEAGAGADTASAQPYGSSYVVRLVQTATPVILGVILLVFGLAFLRTMRTPRAPAPRSGQAVGRRVDEVLTGGPGQSLPGGGGALPSSTAPAQPSTAEDRKRTEAKQGVEALARAKPQDTARLLETWMTEE